jgi:hypothetical protein
MQYICIYTHTHTHTHIHTYIHTYIHTHIHTYTYTYRYNEDVMKKIKFYDDNTQLWWTPQTGGGHVPGLNDLLRPFGIAFRSLLLCY